MNPQTGHVFLVGAGPGDAELLTLKAARVLSKADAVVYDRLISEEVLAMIPRRAIRIYAGKSCNHHTMTQEEIHQTLENLARAGHCVVRLKGGDPLLFGRGGEEAQYLAARNIPFEIVPGITSASAAAAYAGVPLTHRGLATSVRFITGHQVSEGTLNWASLADEQATLVFYMALGKLPEITRQLITHGLAGNTPAAVIQNASLPTQRRIITTLAEAHAQCIAEHIQPPALVIIGNVASLAGTMDWFIDDYQQVSTLLDAANQA